MTRVFRAAVEKMDPYTPGEQPRAGERLIKLNTNENPYPPSPLVARAVRRALADSAWNRYPPPRADEFVTEASKVYGLPREMIMAGNGSDELLAILFRAALEPGRTVAYAAPTYSLYDTLATIQGAEVKRVPYGGDFVLPAEALTRVRAALTIVCNPNSPSGTGTPPAVLGQMAASLRPRLLAIDEAYVDFADSNALELVKQHTNVIVLRTLSKSFSLAGARLGLAFAHPKIVATLIKVKDSYNLSWLALVAGTAALKDVGWMRRNVLRVQRTRAQTSLALRELGFEVPESSANFVLARMAGRDLGPMARELRRRGILVRHFATGRLRDALRISIGRPSEMRELRAVLGDLVRYRK